MGVLLTLVWCIFSTVILGLLGNVRDKCTRICYSHISFGVLVCFRALFVKIKMHNALKLVGSCIGLSVAYPFYLVVVERFALVTFCIHQFS